jgi:hypothetical protein
MPTISTITARAEFTNALVTAYKERTAPTNFLRSFFRNVEKSTNSISIAVQRGTEKIAVDVERGTNGNLNKFNRSTEKIFVPPYYSEFFNINELDVYNTLFTQQDIEISIFADFLTEVVEKMAILQDTIERAYEKQCADVLTTGIVSLNAQTNIDFRRKAASLVDLGAGNYWTDAIDPAVSFNAAGDFLRKTGLSNSTTLDAILGGNLITTLLNNASVKARGAIFQYGLDKIVMPTPTATSVGSTFHGQISAGVYQVRLWSYNQYYQDAAGVSQPYLDPKRVIVLPQNPNFILAFAAVPQLPSANGGIIRKGAYLFDDYLDARKKNHIMEVQSAGVAIPVSVDQIYTMKVIL